MVGRRLGKKCGSKGGLPSDISTSGGYSYLSIYSLAPLTPVIVKHDSLFGKPKACGARVALLIAPSTLSRLL